MNDAVIPALVAAGGGAAGFAAIVAHERARERDMRSSRQAYSIIFPIGTKPEAAEAALRSLSGINYSFELVVEIAADASGIHHLVHIPERVASSVVNQLSAAMPGIRLDPVEARTTGAVTTALRITVPTHAVLRTDDAVHGSRALLAGLGTLRDGERVSLRWALRPSSAPTPVEDTTPTTSLKRKAEQRALQERLDKPGFSVTGLLLVRSTQSARASELIGHVVSVLRSRRSVGAGLMMRRASVRSGEVMPGTGSRRGWLSASELVPLLAWPVGDGAIQGVELGAARRIPVPRGLARDGRRLFVGRDAYGERPVAQSPESARHHLAVLGGTGVGKSTLVANAILQDMEAGFGGIVIDPKADLAADVLDRVPPRHVDRVVVIDPAAPGPVPGLDLLSIGDPDLRADVVLGALGAIFKDSWGIRSDLYLRLGLRTIGELPEPVLTDWLRLFTEPKFRHVAVGQLGDPMLKLAWQSYEALSPAEQHQHVAAPMSKIVSLLSRPAVRSVLAQTKPKLDIARLLAEGRWLVVSLSPGRLGEPAARLLGAILTYATWSAIEARASIAPDKRTPAFLYFDELQSLATLPFGLEAFFERARGLGCGVTVATQALGRLPDSLRQALLGNVGSLVTFRLGYDEAARVARELPGLDSRDLMSLRKFEVAGRIGAGLGSAVDVVTGITEPLPRRFGGADEIRRRSGERFGQDPGEVEAAIRRHQNFEDLGDAPLGRGRRAS